MTTPHRALSKGEELFALHCKAHKLTPEREFRFQPDRKWRFDFFFPKSKLAVEIEGGTYQIGRHQRAGGFVEDCVKYNSAAIMGICVLRYTTEMVESGAAINDVLAALGNP